MQEEEFLIQDQLWLEKLIYKILAANNLDPFLKIWLHWLNTKGKWHLGIEIPYALIKSIIHFSRPFHCHALLLSKTQYKYTNDDDDDDNKQLPFLCNIIRIYMPCGAEDYCRHSLTINEYYYCFYFILFYLL